MLEHPKIWKFRIVEQGPILFTYVLWVSVFVPKGSSKIVDASSLHFWLEQKFS